MKWLAHDEFVPCFRLPAGYRLARMELAHIAAVVTALQRWYPDITFGTNSGYLREEFYRQRVCLGGKDDKDIQVYTLWFDEALAGVWSVERELDSSALYGRILTIAPAHAGTGLTGLISAGSEQAARKMGAAFMYSLVTLKHPYVQQALEHAGYRLLGFFPGYDRELVAPGVVKRVYQAVYAKLLAPENKVLRPAAKNLTPKARALFDLLFPD